MKFSDKIACLEKFGRSFAENDAAGLSEILSSDFVIYEDAGVPYGGAYKGVSGFLELRRKFHETWREFKVEQLNLLDEPDGEAILVVVRLSGTLAFSGEFLECVTSELYKVRNGKIREARIWYWDSGRFGRSAKS